MVWVRRIAIALIAMDLFSTAVNIHTVATRSGVHVLYASLGLVGAGVSLVALACLLAYTADA